ncbi:hypothetical protein CF327_g4474 [Tilletia walkeri]|uniref:Uncharacterized protein n=1 Tax=Tilletia walkeri TaxID=117179 RepID=A0A8X7N545_9BASI|nr:hypothetical protein CF327_g4474 [Tilletia walkeri]KAE8267277.1 hypothetical protein A4X09_0g5067 [Tilletia walkeri]
MASLEATRPAPSASAAVGARTTAESASTSTSSPASIPRALSPPPQRPTSPPFARSQQRHLTLALPSVPDQEPEMASPTAGSTLYDRRQQAQPQSRTGRKLRLPPGRMVSSNSTIGSGSKSGVPVRAQTSTTPTSASMSLNSARLADDDEVEEVLEELEELEDEPEQDQLDSTGSSDIGSSCLAVQNATLAALRSCIYSMLSLSMPEGNTDSSNPVTTVQILNQILQSTYSFSSASASSPPLPLTLTRQLNQVAAQQPLLASSDDLIISHALVNLLAALQAARDAPPPLPTATPFLPSRSRSGDDRSSSSAHGHQRETDSPNSFQHSPLSPPVSTATSNSGSEQATGTRSGVESGTTAIGRRSSMTTVASSPAASDELRDPFAETRSQDEFSNLLRRLQALSALVPDSVQSSRSSNGHEMESDSTTAAQSRSLAQMRNTTPAETKADPWTQLKTSITEVHDLAAVKKRLSTPHAIPSSGTGSRSHSFADPSLPQSMHGHSTAGKHQSRSRSASRRGSFSSINSLGHVLDTGTLPVAPSGSSQDGLLAFAASGDLRSSSSSGRQSSQSIRSSTFSIAGTLAEAPSWVSSPPATNAIGARAPVERRNSLSSTTDVSSSTGPPKYSMDSLVDPYLGGVQSQGDLRKTELPTYTGDSTFRSASEEKVALGSQSQESLASGYAAAGQESSSHRTGDRRKKTLASDLDALEDGLERLFAAGPQLSDQRAELRPRRQRTASDSLTIQDESKDLGLSSAGRSTGKGRAPSSDREEGQLTRQVTLSDVIDKLSRPEMSRMQDQRAAPPTPSMFSARRSVSIDHRIPTSPKASTSHGRSLSQRLIDVVSFKLPALSQRRSPPAPLLLSGPSNAAMTKSAPWTAGAQDFSQLPQDPVYIGGAKSASKLPKERAGSMDLFHAIDAVSRASSRSFDDQRVSLKVRTGTDPKKQALSKIQWDDAEAPQIGSHQGGNDSEPLDLAEILSSAPKDEGDFQGRLSGATSPTDSRIPSVMEQATSSGWTVSPKVSQA